MNTLNTMPGFTAEASLCNVSTRYQVTAEATIHGGLVEPAGPFSDSTTLDTSFRSSARVYASPDPVLQVAVFPVAEPKSTLLPDIGFWNSTTQRCE